jgi:LysM repeat protein
MRRRRSPVRWLAPIALVACAVVVYSVVNAGLLSDEPASTSPASKSSTTSKSGSKRSTSSKRRSAKRRRTYTVKAGDTLSSISAKTGVSLERIQGLNPELDSQSLQTGQLVKLSP